MGHKPKNFKKNGHHLMDWQKKTFSHKRSSAILFLKKAKIKIFRIIDKILPIPFVFKMDYKQGKKTKILVYAKIFKEKLTHRHKTLNLDQLSEGVKAN
ncbi:hypothetical protein BpHYR1_017692 [Brachionus plicatilis]|uniref:Uncharacterized protein n=1 Tax=Brachionus plicatilis TaxID=10195 RepID=A0A3M7S8Q1_BRAPC|nr:hypothetical protein BpHYR1_017692 [Brachionus plicatilis]